MVELARRERQPEQFADDEFEIFVNPTGVFELGGPQTLDLYWLEGYGGGVFLSFADATSGTETYGAGRYLDLEPENDGTYVLDFNLAYHPSCVYDVIFSCPITPPENRLPIRVEAGERLAG